MRLPEVERGDSVRHRALIRIISKVSGTRLPDAGRVALYHRGFVGPSFGAWTQAVMRGPSEWTVGERELMAAMVGHWNSNAFCVGAHRATATVGLGPDIVDACLVDYQAAAISEPLRATLAFLEIMTLRPGDLRTSDAVDAMDAGVSRSQLADAAAVAAVFNIITRYAHALDFAIPTDVEFEKVAAMLLKRGYG